MGRSGRRRAFPNRGNRMCKSLEARKLGVLDVWGTERNSYVLRLKTSLFFQGSFGSMVGDTRRKTEEIGLTLIHWSVLLPCDL